MTAIFFEDDVPEQWKHYTPLNAEWFKTHEFSGEWRARTERHGNE